MLLLFPEPESTASFALHDHFLTKMRILTGEDVSGLLRSLSSNDARELLNSFSQGLADYSKAKGSSNANIIQPARVVFQNAGQNTVLTMPVSDGDTVVKVATVPHKGDIAGAITVYNSVGELQGVLNAAEITAFRTALASMTILTRWPAPSHPSVCVFGSGKQAEWHLRLALLLIPGITKVIIFNRGAKRLKDLESAVLSGLRDVHSSVEFETVASEGNSSYSSTLRERLAKADIICCCTPSTEPLFTNGELQSTSKSRFMSLIGSYKPSMHEIDADTLRAARESGKIYVDTEEGCLEEAGELISAGFGPDDLIEVGQLFAQTGPAGSEVDGERSLTIFKCVGFGFMDLLVSKSLLSMAEEASKGNVVDDF
ncbi:ornithine cyclodeaminase/mu-crystallin family protein [Neohortaea acidophila]|uniref:Ornithine cyclodeaminase/mu-crystallin family protein n=1 Tax=Neohortaea acidophila TaxID=245834 RepID=A0A6A6PH34_9PEZI|nr:ornithine cyclodeaminase/mu-crystallin family protein [Neohortaea acidophila]KAF2478923.1 ornithine cyclodeaminase/mu-crystallin family protein [Neohortaea acidophila]